MLKNNKLMQRFVSRKLPDGNIGTVHPFHISMEGHKTAILCKDDDDYDAMVKILCVTARRKNVKVIIYAVVSNHSHIAVLATKQADAYEYGWEIKRIYSMWYSKRYGRTGVMQGIDVKAIPLDTDSHVRNALAYIPRNAIDNGCNVNEYRWSGFNAMFSQTKPVGNAVRMLKKRETEQIMHTGDCLSDVNWLLDDNGFLIPGSWCDTEYLEQAFENDQAYFMRIIGDVNSAQMHQILIDNPRTRLPDTEFLKYANEKSQLWYRMDLSELPKDKKMRITSYLYRTMSTTVAQLVRVTGLAIIEVEASIKRKKNQ